MTKRLIRSRWVAGLFAALIALTSISVANAQEKSRLQVVLERGKLIVATMATVPPFAMRHDQPFHHSARFGGHAGAP